MSGSSNTKPTMGGNAMLGKIILDLPPSPGNPRNSEGAMLRLNDGSILFIYSRFCGSDAADDAAADLYALISDDEGEHFHSLGPVVFHAETSAKNVMSVSLLRMENGDIGLFYLERRGETDMRMMLRRSADEGRTWTDPAICMPNSGYYVVNNDRVLRLCSGRILLPAALHRLSLRDDGSTRFDSRADFLCVYSDDDGRTWREGAGKCALAPAGPSQTGLQEPGVVELEPGMLWAWARTDLGRQYETFSLDGGETWTPAAPSAFTGPMSPLPIKRLPDGSLLAVYNPIPLYNGRPEIVNGVWTGGRTPLCLARMRNRTQSAPHPIAIEDDPASGYCYVSIFPAKDGVLLSYCAGGPNDGSCLNRLRIRKIRYEELPAEA